MLFELTNAPAIFQRLINHMLYNHLNKFVIAYLDNILIYSENEKNHEKHVKKVLKKLQKKKKRALKKRALKRGVLEKEGVLKKKVQEEEFDLWHIMIKIIIKKRLKKLFITS